MAVVKDIDYMAAYQGSRQALVDIKAGETEPLQASMEGKAPDWVLGYKEAFEGWQEATRNGTGNSADA